MSSPKPAESIGIPNRHSLEFLHESFPFRHSIANPYLFNSDRYLHCHDQSKLFRFVLLKEEQVLMETHLMVENNEAFNPPKASFGGIEYTDQLEESQLEEFLKGLKGWGRKNGIRKISLKCPSGMCHPKQPWLEKLLLERGFQLTVQEVNQHIEISEEPFVNRIKANEKRRLRKCMEAGFKFKLMTRSDLPQAYKIIVDTRKRRGFPVTMEFEALDKMFKELPEHYLLFGLYSRERLISVVVSILVRRNILYNFYPGDDAQYRDHSPMVMLLDGIYRYCQTNELNVLDLGISSVNGVLNPGLHRFKRNCGAVDSWKCSYYLQLGN